MFGERSSFLHIGYRLQSIIFLCKVPFEEEAYLAKQKEAKVEEYAALKRKDLTDSLQAIIAATDYLANSFWDKIHNPNPDKRLNETAYYDKVGLQGAKIHCNCLQTALLTGGGRPAQPGGPDCKRGGESQL